MIETRRLKKVVIFIQTILSFVLSRKIYSNVQFAVSEEGVRTLSLETMTPSFTPLILMLFRLERCSSFAILSSMFCMSSM